MLTGCTDPCDRVQCLNGGACDNGACNCPPGYSGPNCETYDPCYHVSCYNGGYCNNGQCNCPPGYTGPACETHLKPKAMIVNEIVVTNYPHTNLNNEGWDALYPGAFGAAPDMYAAVERNATLLANSYRVQNASYTQPIHLTFENQLVYSPLNGRCDITLMDSDWDEGTYPDPIGGYYFFPEDFSATTPAVIALYNSDTWHKIQMELHVTWVY